MLGNGAHRAIISLMIVKRNQVVLQDILQALSDGKFHSGVAMAQHMGVSKTHIHHMIHELMALGIDISAVRGRGYRIYGGLDLLDLREIKQALPGVYTDIRLQTGSTNDDCRHTFMSNKEDFVLSSAELQTAGRGRRGKHWSSPFAKHLYASFGFTLSLPLTRVSGITLAAGVVVARLLDKLGVKGVGVKWPNDIWVESRKIAGILTEVVGDAQGPCTVVIGLGLNIYPVNMVLDKHQEVTYLCEHGVTLSRTQILTKLTQAMLTLRDTYEREGFTGFQAIWQDYDLLAGQDISVAMTDRVIEARCLGISEEGLLQIDKPPYTLVSGDVSVRPSS